MAKLNLFSKHALVIVLLIASFASAGQEKRGNTSVQHFGAKEEGWFWYKDPKEVEPKKAAPEPEPKKKSEEKSEPEKEAPFSVKWLQEQYPKLREKAIEEPTDDNIRAFLYAQRLILDKAQNFATAAHRVANLDPLLDENNRIPFATAAKAVMLRHSDKARDEALKHVATLGGLWFFFDSTCEWCAAQHAYMGRFKDQYNFIIKNISVDGRGITGMGANFVKDKGQAKLLGLQTTPTTVLVVPPDKFLIVSQGMNSVEGLADKILLAAEANNLVPKHLSAARNPYEKGILKSEDMKSGALSDDPKEWVRYLQEKIGGRSYSD